MRQEPHAPVSVAWTSRLVQEPDAPRASWLAGAMTATSRSPRKATSVVWPLTGRTLWCPRRLALSDLRTLHGALGVSSTPRVHFVADEQTLKPGESPGYLHEWVIPLLGMTWQWSLRLKRLQWITKDDNASQSAIHAGLVAEEDLRGENGNRVVVWQLWPSSERRGRMWQRLPPGLPLHDAPRSRQSYFRGPILGFMLLGIASLLLVYR